MKAQIEADKRERADKAARDKALREGRTQEATPAAPAQAATLPKPAASTSNESRLRIRAPGGQWMGTVPAETTLAQVEDMVRKDGKATGPLKVSGAEWLERLQPSSSPDTSRPFRLPLPTHTVLPNVPSQVLHRCREGSVAQGAGPGAQCCTRGQCCLSDGGREKDELEQEESCCPSSKVSAGPGRESQSSSTMGRRVEAGTILSQTKQSVDTVIDYSGKAYRHFSPLAATESVCFAPVVHCSLLRPASYPPI